MLMWLFAVFGPAVTYEMLCPEQKRSQSNLTNSAPSQVSVVVPCDVVLWRRACVPSLRMSGTSLSKALCVREHLPPPRLYQRPQTDQAQRHPDGCLQEYTAQLASAGTWQSELQCRT